MQSESKSSKILTVILALYAIVIIWRSAYIIYLRYDYDIFDPTTDILAIIAGVIIFVSAVLYNWKKQALCGLIIALPLFAYVNFFTLVDSVNEWDYRQQESYMSDNYSDSTTVENTIAESETAKEEKKSPEEVAKSKIIGTYTLATKDNYLTWHFSINDDGTCTLYEERDPEGIWHGSWEYVGKSAAH